MLARASQRTVEDFLARVRFSPTPAYVVAELQDIRGYPSQSAPQTDVRSTIRSSSPARPASQPRSSTPTAASLPPSISALLTSRYVERREALLLMLRQRCGRDQPQSWI